MYRILYALLFWGAIWACSSDGAPESIDTDACFEAVSEAMQESSITFTSGCSGNAESYLWDFGDGTTSTEMNPVHVYAKAGTFEVTLTITAGDQTTDMFTSGIKITSIPTKSHFIDITEDET
jgi:PKD repeat protein